MTQKLFPDFGSEGLREARLVFETPPERTETRSRNAENLARNDRRLADVLGNLRAAAAQSDNRELNRMLSDSDVLHMIAGQVALPPDNDSTKVWLQGNGIAQHFLRKIHESFRREGTVAAEWKDRNNKQVLAIVEELKKSLAALRTLEAHDKFGGTLPGCAGAEGVELRKLIAESADPEKMRKHLDHLINLTKEIVFASDADILSAGAPPDWLGRLKAAGVPAAGLTEIGAKKEAADRRNAMLTKLREAAAIRIPARLQELLRKAVTEAETQISKLEADRKAILEDAFKKSIVYLDRVGGTDQETLIRLALEINGKFRLDGFLKLLEILTGAPPTPAQQEELKKFLGLKDAASVQLDSIAKDEKEKKAVRAQVDATKAKYGIASDGDLKTLIFTLLTKGRGDPAVEVARKNAEKEMQKKDSAATLKIGDFARDILSVWNTEAAEEYLRTIGVKNPAGVSISAAALRAKMPLSVVEALEAGTGEKRPSPGVLIAIAKMENFGKKRKEVTVGATEASAKLADSLFKEFSYTTGPSKKWIKISDLQSVLEGFFSKAETPSDEAKKAINKFKADSVIMTPGDAEDAKTWFVVGDDAAVTALRTTVAGLKVPGDWEPGTALGSASAKAIVESVTEPMSSGTGLLLKNRDLLLQYVAFLHFKTDWATAMADADAYITRMTGKPGEDKPITAGPDSKFLVVKAKLIEELGKLSLAAGSKPKDLYDQMRSARVHEFSVRESAGMVASEFWKLAKVGAGLWGGYMADTLKFFSDPEHDPALKRINRQLSALDEEKKILTGLQGAGSGSERILTDAAEAFRTLKGEQENALAAGPVTALKDHIAHAHALELANHFVLRQLNALGWNQRSLRLRLFTLWLAMNRGSETDREAGLKEAQQVLRFTDGMSAEEQEAYVDRAMEAKKFSDAERRSFADYENNVGLVNLHAGREVLTQNKQHGLLLKKEPLTLLRETQDPVNPAVNLAAYIGQWLMGPRQRLTAALALVWVDGDAKRAHLAVLETGTEQEYVFQGKRISVTLADARRAVEDVERHLQHMLRGAAKTREQVEDEDDFSNPIDQWMRTGIDSMKDLWKTDWIGKAQVIAMGFAAYWMIKEVWKSKTGKFGLLGFATLLGVNTIIKQRTGRDFLGENLRWKSKEERASPLEAFRRRAAVLDSRYAVLLEPAGQQAIHALMDEKNPVAVADLLRWREAVKSGGGDFMTGAPPNLRVSDIDLGEESSPQKSYEVAYIAFEALCADVAHVNHLGGADTDQRAERGAEFIRDKYTGSGRSLRRPATMVDVMLSECQTPVRDILANRNYLEWLSDFCGMSVDDVKDFVKKHGTKALLLLRRGAEAVPGAVEAGKRYAVMGWEGFWSQAQLMYDKGVMGVEENWRSLWNFLSTTAVQGGITLVSWTPGAAEWSVDKAIALAEGGRDIAVATYRTLLRNGVTGPIIDSFVKEIASVTGWNIDKFWSKSEHKEKLSDFDDFLKTLEAQVSTVAHLPPNPKEYFRKLTQSVPHAVTAGGIDKVQDRLLTYELARRQVFSFIAAQRIHAITALEREPIAKKRLTLPLTPTWPNDATKFHKVCYEDPASKDDVYRYLYDNYDLPVMLAAMGNQQTFIGLMKLYADKRPGLTRSKAFSWLLWPGIHEYVTRNEASEFLVSQWKSYAEKELEKAKKDLSPEEFKRYEAYVSTLLSNVMVEMILDVQADKKPADLKLLKGHAKEFYRQLMMRRGTLAAHTEAAKWNADLYAQFDRSATANPDPPKEISDIASDKDLKWVLLGETPPEMPPPPGAAPGAPGAAPSSAPTVLPPTRVTAIEAQLDDKIKKDTGRKELIDALAAPGNDALKTRIRAAFDVLPDPTLSDSAPPKDIEPFISTLLGRNAAGAQALGEGYLTDRCENMARTAGERMTYATWLADQVASLRSTYPNQPRLQRFLDQAAATLLTQVAQELGGLKKADFMADPTNRTVYETTLLALFKMTAESRNPALSDDVSQVLEYVLYGDDKKKTYKDYKEYLKSKGLVPPAVGGGRRFRDVWIIGSENDCDMRFWDGIHKRDASTIKKLGENAITTHLNAAKAAAW